MNNRVELDLNLTTAPRPIIEALALHLLNQPNAEALQVINHLHAAALGVVDAHHIVFSTTTGVARDKKFLTIMKMDRNAPARKGEGRFTLYFDGLTSFITPDDIPDNGLIIDINEAGVITLASGSGTFKQSPSPYGYRGP